MKPLKYFSPGSSNKIKSKLKSKEVQMKPVENKTRPFLLSFPLSVTLSL